MGNYIENLAKSLIGSDVKPDVYAAATRLEIFCKQFNKMTEEEKEICIDRTDKLGPYELAELYNYLVKYFEVG